MTATYQTRGDVAVITLDNPPVNGLGYDTRLGIVNGLEKALADAAVSDGTSWDVVQLQASRSQPILDMHRMAAQNPVWIVTASKENV